MNARLDRGFYLRLFLVVYAAWLTIYSSVGIVASTFDTIDLSTPLDRALPVRPNWVWIYDFAFVLPVFLVVLLRDGHALNRLIISVFVATLGASVVYLLIPIAYPFPELGDSIAERWVKFHYAHGFPPGANKMPSMHVANAFMFWLAVRHGSRSRVAHAVMLGLAVVIAASTVLIRQHLVIDVLTGIPWAFLAWAVAGRLYAPYRALGLGPEDTVRHVRSRAFRWIPGRHSA